MVTGCRVQGITVTMKKAEIDTNIKIGQITGTYIITKEVMFPSVFCLFVGRIKRGTHQILVLIQELFSLSLTSFDQAPFSTFPFISLSIILES